MKISVFVPLKIIPENIKIQVHHSNYFVTQSGKIWGLRKIPDYELILLINGLFRYEDRTEKLELKKGDILCIPPGAAHIFAHTGGKGVISCIHLDLSESKPYTPCPEPQTVTHPENFDFFHQLFSRCSYVFAGFSRSKAVLLSSIAGAIWTSLSDYWTCSDQTAVSPRMQEMIVFLRENLFKGVNRNDLAHRFGRTPEHINYLFKKELSITPGQFINREKIMIGFNILQSSNLSVKEVAVKLGFCDQYHFSKLFKRYIGLNPSDFKSRRTVPVTIH